MGFLLNLIGAVADTYARGGGWSGGGPAGAWTYLEQKEYWSNDDGRYAPPINSTYEAWQHSAWPYREWPK